METAHPGRVVLQHQSLQPPGLAKGAVQLEQPELLQPQPMGVLEQNRPLHFPQAARPRGEHDLVAGEGVPGELDAEALATQPQRVFPSGYPFLGIDLPMFETRVAGGVEYSGEPPREVSTPQILRSVTSTRKEARNLRRAPAGVLAVFVRPVFLGVGLCSRRPRSRSRASCPIGTASPSSRWSPSSFSPNRKVRGLRRGCAPRYGG